MAKKQNNETETNEIENRFEPVTTEEMYERQDEGAVHKINAGDTVKGVFVGFFESPAIDSEGNPIENQKWLQIGLTLDDSEGVEMFRCTRGLKNALRDSEVREMDTIQIKRKGAGLTDTKWTITKFENN